MATYRLKDCDVAIGDRVLKSHAGDVSISPESPTVTAQQDAEGNVVWSLFKNTLFKVTISLLWSAADLEHIQSLTEADLDDGSGEFPMSIVDSRSGTKFTAEAAHFAAPPPVKFGLKESQAVEVEIIAKGSLHLKAE